MGWERNGRQLVYTRSRRLPGGRVGREYFGSGAPALAAAAADEARRSARSQVLSARRREEETWSAAARLLREHRTFVERLVSACLLAMGYHRYQRHWRLRRQ